MDTFRTKDLARVDYEVGMADSDGKPIPDSPRKTVSVIYNKNVISADELARLMESGMYEYDNRVICMSPEQADNMAAKHPNARVSDVIRNMSDESLAILLAGLTDRFGPKFLDLVRKAVDQKGQPLTPAEDVAYHVIQVRPVSAR